MALRALPAEFAATRESLRILACYAVAPARKARTGRIGLRPVDGGFGTPPLDDGSRIVVRGDRLAAGPDRSTKVTTLRDAAAFLGVDLSPDPGVGHDLPPYGPDVDLVVDEEASLALGAWYAFGQGVLDELRARLAPDAVSEAQLWPEHFDLAVTVTLAAGAQANVGFSPGDAFAAEPYAYVGPHRMDGLTGAYWNAPFGAIIAHDALASAADPAASALAFVLEGLDRTAAATPGGGTGAASGGWPT